MLCCGPCTWTLLCKPQELKGTQRNSKELEGTQSRKEVDEVPFFDSNLPLHCHFPTHGLARVGRRGCSTATSWVVDAPALVSGRTRTRRISFMMVYVSLCFVVILLYGSWPCLPHTPCTDDANATKVEDKSLKEIESIEIPPVVLEEKNDPWP